MLNGITYLLSPTDATTRSTNLINYKRLFGFCEPRQDLGFPLTPNSPSPSYPKRGIKIPPLEARGG